MTIAATPVISLHLPAPGDAAALFALVDANRTALAPWLPWVLATASADHSLAFIHASLAARQQGSQYDWLIRVDGQLAGVCGLHSVSAANRRACIGYWLGQDFVGRGVLQAALAQLCQHAFGPLQLQRLVIDPAQANRRSVAVAERAGFCFEGILRQHLWLHGQPHDAACYSLLASDWAARQSVQP